MTLWPVKVQLAVRALAAGGVIAYPTEAVWGLGCDPFDPVAVSRLLALKQRPAAKGLILVAADIRQLAPFLTALSGTEIQTLQGSWPGPVTWLVPDNGAAPEWITGQSEKLAVRVSAHPVVRALCREFGGPIVSTSANPAGQAPARNQCQVMAYFPRQLDAIVPGPVGGSSKPTEIRDALTGVVHRPAQ